MAIELKVPSVGESITEVQIGEWLKALGDPFGADEGLVVIETDKVTVELPAPVAGVITKMLKEAGEVAEVGEVIGYMEEGEAPAASADAAAEAPAPTEVAAPAEAPGSDNGSGTGPAHVMPAAQRALAEKGLSAEQVQASGPGGRLLKEDVERHAASPAPPAASPATSAPKAPAPSAPAVPGGARDEEVVPLTPMRKRIAERLVQAQQTAAILTTFNEIDMSAVMALRKEQQESFVARHGIKLGFMSFFVKAVIEAGKLVPQLNAELRDDAIVYRNYYDVGIAVGGGKGLVVPVIRNAERLSFAEVEQTIADYAARAQDNRLALEELQGGTFTISNGGIYGSLLSTPILNPPQSGILGLHAIQERPVAVDGEIVIRPMMYVAMSYDHRIVDGREAVTFLKRVKECVEQPARMLIES